MTMVVRIAGRGHSVTAIATLRRHGSAGIRMVPGRSMFGDGGPIALPLASRCSAWSPQPGTGTVAVGVTTELLYWRVNPLIPFGTAHYSTGRQQNTGTGPGQSSGHCDDGHASGRSSEVPDSQASDGGDDRGESEAIPWTKTLLLSAGVAALAVGGLHFALSSPAIAAMISCSSLASMSVSLISVSIVVFIAGVATRCALAAGAAPVLAVAGSVCQGRAQEDFKACFRKEALQEAARGCSQWPAEAVVATSAAPIREFETNRIHWEAEFVPTSAGAVSWRLRAQARRPWFWRPWEVTFVEVSCQEPPSLAAAVAAAPPPQVRHWSSEGRPSGWRVAWQRGAAFAPGREAAFR